MAPKQQTKLFRNIYKRAGILQSIYRHSSWPQKKNKKVENKTGGKIPLKVNDKHVRKLSTLSQQVCILESIDCTFE